MGGTGTRARARQAGHTVYTASQRAGRISAAAAGGAGRIVHRLSGASGASRTGLSHLIELTAAGSVGDAFVAVSLAGTLFFSTSVEEARSRVAFALLVTIAPYAILAPLIGPLLDRVKQGNRYIIMGTLLARGLLCWGMAAAIHDPVTLLPAAFGVLVLQKVYGVTKSAITPRLLPAEITLVTANARANLGSLIATSLGAALALGVDKLAGGGSGGGAAWVLRVATVIYLAAMLLGLRLPDRVDVQAPGSASDGLGPAVPFASPTGESAAGAPAAGAPFPGGPVPGGATANGATSDGASPNGAGPNGPAGTRPLPVRERRLFGIPKVGPVVSEAMRGNAAIRIFYGFMLFFLAFILRSEHFGHTPATLKLGGLAVAVAAGGMIGTGIGSALKSRAPQAMMFTVIGITAAVSTACAILFGLWSVWAVALAAAIAQTLVKVALDAILQREISEERRASTFAFSETVHQLALVSGGLLGLLLSLTGSGFTGLTVGAAGLLAALCWLVLSRRRRILHTRPAAPSPAR